MTSRQDELQQLIADIDNLLNSSSKRLPRLLSSQAQEPKELLERTRAFLIQLQESETADNSELNQLSEMSHRSPLLEKFIDQGQNPPTSPPLPTHSESHLALTEQLKQEFSTCIQPLKAEITALIQERTLLIQEIRQLEQKRLQNYSLSQQIANQEQIISEFLQVLMNRLTPALMPKLAEVADNASSFGNQNHLSSLEMTPGTDPSFGETAIPTERFSRLTQELDQRLLSLDSTVNVVFDALQRNINTYHDSLSQALARMHSTGLQGEQLLVNLLSNLTQYPPQNLSSVSPPNLQLEQPSPPVSANVSELPQVKEPEVTAATSLNVETEPVYPAESAPALTDELDAMLLQLGVDEPVSTESLTTPDILSDKGTEPTDDEVDLIYASLFGADLFDVDTPENPPIAPQNVLPEVDMAVMMPETWFEESEPELFDSDRLQDIPDPPPEPTESIEPPAVALIEPSIEDTITSFADLFTDVDFSELNRISHQEIITPTASVVTPESTAAAPNVAPVIAETTNVIEEKLEPQPPAITHPAAESPATPIIQPITHLEAEHSPTEFIPASAQENLLSPDINHLANLPEISLNEEQWLKLHQDLAKLDEPSSQPSLIGWESAEFWVNEDLRPSTGDRQSIEPEVRENTPADNFPAATETVVDFRLIEKKKEVTTTDHHSSVVTPDTPVNYTAPPSEPGDSVWYLGIDLGTTGISATLLNRSTGVVYPICWTAEAQPGTNSFQQSFRLPAEVYLPNTSAPPRHSEGEESASQLKNHLYSAQLKPYLQVAIPYKNAQQKWQPVLQFNEFSAGPLIWVVRSLSKLLLTLKADRDSTTQGLIATAVGLDANTFRKIIDKIAGVICNCPSSCSEQYRFNLREALLTSKLVQHPQQVFFVEEAIASLLSIFNGAHGETVQLSTHKGLTPAQSSDYAIVGNTLVINIGANSTEMGLVDVPENLVRLSHHDFMLHGFAYASKGLEQDIICQLLLPPKYRQSRGENSENQQPSHHWQWQSAFPNLDAVQWQSLGWEELELPRVGEPDIQTRILLQQHLESSLLGQAVLDAALALKLILQRQESFSFELADQRWNLQRRDLETQVFVPFVRRLNRELNKLLVARGIPTEAINQVILTGGVATLAVVNRWLRQKLPNARMIQDTYLGENGIPNCSRVAYGLAVLPLHPHVLEESRHQYTDYFLFTELLRLLPDRTLAFGEVLQLFEARGINTSICQQRLLAFLEGELPAGLIPVPPESTWLTQNSQTNFDYQAIAATPLVEKQGNLTYRPNFSQLQIFHRYLESIKVSTQQSLDEPYTINFSKVARS